MNTGSPNVVLGAGYCKFAPVLAFAVGKPVATHTLCEECWCPVPSCVSLFRCCDRSWNLLCLATVIEAGVCADSLGVGNFFARFWVCIALDVEHRIGFQYEQFFTDGHGYVHVAFVI